MRPDDLKPAPEPLRLVQRFLNTRSLMRNLDLLDSCQSFHAWLRENLGGIQYWVPDESDLRHYRAVREALRTLLVTHAPDSGVPAPSAAEALNKALGPVALEGRFSLSGDPVVLAKGKGAEAFDGALLLAAIDAHYRGMWGRLKICPDEGCRWAFYDASKNRSAAWCDMAMCGSRSKMRAYRNRRSAKSQQ